VLDTFYGFFQIVGLTLFLGLFLGRTLHLRISRRINAITLSAIRKGNRGLVEIGLFVGVNIWITIVLWHALHRAFGAFPSPFLGPSLDFKAVELFGILLIILSFVVFIRALRDLGSSWRLGIDEQRPVRLVTSGIYAFSRHPIYLFFHLYFWGTFLLNGTPILLVLAILLGVNLHLQALQEEAFLIQTQESAYRAYSARTARYFAWKRLLSDWDEKEYGSDQIR
jgi:protein-S-isoprenylcysteine O-methyltransferase Ste14